MKNLHYIFFILSVTFLFCSNCFISTNCVQAQDVQLIDEPVFVSYDNYNDNSVSASMRRRKSKTARTAGTNRRSCNYYGGYRADSCVNQSWEQVRAEKKARREAKRQRQQQ